MFFMVRSDRAAVRSLSPTASMYAHTRHHGYDMYAARLLVAAFIAGNTKF